MIHKYHTLERSNYFAVEDVDAFIGEMDIAKIKWVGIPHCSGWQSFSSSSCQHQQEGYFLIWQGG